MSTVPIVYCENGALSARLKALKRQGKIRLQNFPADEEPSKKISPVAAPPAAYWEDMGVNWEQIPVGFEKIAASEKFDEILKIIGRQNRRDALHVDSAYKTGAACIVSNDRHILDVGTKLRDLLGLQVFSPTDETLYRFLSA